MMNLMTSKKLMLTSILILKRRHWTQVFLCPSNRWCSKWFRWWLWQDPLLKLRAALILQMHITKQPLLVMEEAVVCFPQSWRAQCRMNKPRQPYRMLANLNQWTLPAPKCLVQTINISMVTIIDLLAPDPMPYLRLTWIVTLPRLNRLSVGYH